MGLELPDVMSIMTVFNSGNTGEQTLTSRPQDLGSQSLVLTARVLRGRR